jgi:hypothetical protein
MKLLNNTLIVFFNKFDYLLRYGEELLVEKSVKELVTLDGFGLHHPLLSRGSDFLKVVALELDAGHRRQLTSFNSDHFVTLALNHMVVAGT